MLTFNLKKQWFDKIKSGEKTHEYREVKPYWFNRIGKCSCLFFNANNRCFSDVLDNGKFTDNLDIDCEFICGYASKDDKNKRLKAILKTITVRNGKHTDLAIDKDVYDIEFELVRE